LALTLTPAEAQNLLRPGAADAVDRLQGDFGVLVVGNVYPCDAGHPVHSIQKDKKRLPPEKRNPKIILETAINANPERWGTSTWRCLWRGSVQMTRTTPFLRNHLAVAADFLYRGPVLS